MSKKESTLLWFIIKKITLSLVLILAVIISLYLVARLLPGDPITVLYGEAPPSEELRRIIEEKMYLNKPLYMQVLVYLRNIFSGNWGKSIFTGEPILEIVCRALYNSIILAMFTIILTTIICFLLAYLEFICGSRVSPILSMVASATASIPTISWGAILMLVAVRLHLHIFSHITLPLLTLTIAGTGIFYKLLRNSLLYAYQQSFILLYKALGIGKGSLFLKLLRFVAPLFISATLYRLGLIIAGAIAVEALFAYPGMGKLFVDSLVSRDYPVLLGWSIATSILLITINTAIDIIHSLIDPRVYSHVFK